jgi:hypothetical protein
MLTKNDVPSPWRLVHSPLPKAQSEALETALGLTSTADERARVSWDQIEHGESGVRVSLRMVPIYSGGSIIGSTVSAQLATPPPGQDELNFALLRGLPIRDIQARASARWARTAGVLAEVLGGPDPSRAHLERFSERWNAVWDSGDRNPAAALAIEYGKSANTMRRWAQDAREAGLIPEAAKGAPGRPAKSKGGSR